MEVKAYLQLIRAPGIFSIFSNITASFIIFSGLTIANDFEIVPYTLTLVISFFCYQVGMMTNDLADFVEDSKERPFRPLPSLKISKLSVKIIALVLCITALIVATFISWQLFLFVVAMLLFILSYNYLTKNSVLGCLNMGGVRLLNWSLVLVVFLTFNHLLFLSGLIVLFYTVLITLISRYETEDFPLSIKKWLYILIGLMVVSLLFILSDCSTTLLNGLPILIFCTWLIFKVDSFSPCTSQDTQKFVTTLLKYMVVLDGLLLVTFGHYFLGVICCGLILLSSKVVKYVYLT